MTACHKVDNPAPFELRWPFSEVEESRTIWPESGGNGWKT